MYFCGGKKTIILLILNNNRTDETKISTTLHDFGNGYRPGNGSGKF